MKKNYISVKLSSKWTGFGYYFTWFALIFMIPPFFYLFATSEGPTKWLGMLFTLAFAGGLIYLILFLSEGYIKENVIYLKKYMRPEVSYTLDKVENVQVYENRKDNYILLTMKGETKPEKYILVTSKLFYAGEKRNTKTVLREILNENKKLAS